MEEPIGVTIDSLRARLLSERSVSKSERQRADELAQRVLELEEQLKVVSLQRKKAEKATEDVLSILGNHGISDLSEGFDSNSEQDESPHNITAHNGSMTMRDTSTNPKLTTNVSEAFSSSEFESSPATGRSLSWRSNKNSQQSLQKKTYMESVRRKGIFASNNPSARRIGKSCRRIRRWESRSLDESQNEGYENATSSVDVSNCSDGESVAMREDSEHDNDVKQLGSPFLGSNAGDQNIENMKDGEIGRSLQHQYDKEKKGQREWEANCRRNNRATQDSCDPGNHSDITEERYETKSPEPSSTTAALNSDYQEKKQGSIDTGFIEEPRISEKSSSVSHPGKETLLDENQQIHACNSSASGFLATALKEKSDKDLPGQSISLLPGKSSSDHNLSVAANEISDNVASVLEALQQAKLFLNQKHPSSSPAAGGTTSSNILKRSGKTGAADGSCVQFMTRVLFRLPTDYEFEATSRADPGQRPIVRSSFGTGNYPSAISNSRFLASPSIELRSSSSPGLFHTDQPELTPQRTLSMPKQSDGLTTVNRTSPLSAYGLTTVNRTSPLSAYGLISADRTSPLSAYGLISADRTSPLSAYGLISADRTSPLSASRGPAQESVRDLYPFVPDITPRLPLNDEWDARRRISSESRQSPFQGQYTYDQNFRPNMYG